MENKINNEPVRVTFGKGEVQILTAREADEQHISILFLKRDDNPKTVGTITDGFAGKTEFEIDNIAVRMKFENEYGIDALITSLFELRKSMTGNPHPSEVNELVNEAKAEGAQTLQRIRQLCLKERSLNDADAIIQMQNDFKSIFEIIESAPLPPVTTKNEEPMIPAVQVKNMLYEATEFGVQYANPSLDWNRYKKDRERVVLEILNTNGVKQDNNGWISVKDDLPKQPHAAESLDVLTYGWDDEYVANYRGKCFFSRDKVDSDGNPIDITIYITDWMYLPPSPINTNK